jgi:hypothetical protein
MDLVGALKNPRNDTVFKVHSIENEPVLNEPLKSSSFILQLKVTSIEWFTTLRSIFDLTHEIDQLNFQHQSRHHPMLNHFLCFGIVISLAD